MSFNKGPAFGLSAEIKNKVGGQMFYILFKESCIELFFFVILASITCPPFWYACLGQVFWGVC